MLFKNVNGYITVRKSNKIYKEHNMKKNLLLNSEISYVISKMGHTDTITIGDAGLPIPEGVERIDLSISKGVPDFMPVLEAVISELEVEEITIAEELENTSENSKKIYHEIMELFEDKNIKINIISHEKFKEAVKKSKAVIRTGEFTPYANIILQSGVVF